MSSASPDAVRRVIGLTGQYATVDEELSGIENLMLIGRLLEIPRAQAKAKAYELLEQFSLTDAAKKVAKNYSGGMRRRLDLAVSLIGNPEVLFLDEPTTGLDPRARQEVWDVVHARVADGVTVLLTTQYLDEAEQLAGEIVVLDKGRVIASGTPDALEVAGRRPDPDRAAGRPRAVARGRDHPARRHPLRAAAAAGQPERDCPRGGRVDAPRRRGCARHRPASPCSSSSSAGPAWTRSS